MVLVVLVGGQRLVMLIGSTVDLVAEAVLTDTRTWTCSCRIPQTG